VPALRAQATIDKPVCRAFQSLAQERWAARVWCAGARCVTHDPEARAICRTAHGRDPL